MASYSTVQVHLEDITSCRTFTFVLWMGENENYFLLFFWRWRGEAEFSFQTRPQVDIRASRPYVLMVGKS
jgi:hypothetical protein